MRPPSLATLVMAWEARRFAIVCSAALLEEYDRVLAYPEVAKLIFPELLRAFRSHLIYDIELVEVPEEIVQVCRDPDDDKVIATALIGMVDYLVTEDSDLRTEPVVALLRNAGVAVISTTELMRLLT